MPNTFAYIALLSWPIFTFYLLRRFGTGPGALIALLASYMFLPAAFSVNLPGIPALNKFTITIFTILIFIILHGRELGFNYLNKRFKLLLLIFIVAPFLTALTNQQHYLHLPGLSLYDGLSSSVTSFLEFFPFLIGLAYFREEKEHFTLFKYFAIAAFVYSFFALFEIRMSPQLHTWVYGYFPHDWIQQYRSGGFRAVVFMGHGLLVAMFLALGVAFWSALYKSKSKVFRYSAGLGLVLVFMTLLLSKSLAALLYGLLAFAAIKFLKTKQIYFISAAMAVVFITYPISSATGLFPHNAIIGIASEISEERSGSLSYRFSHENALLVHANKKPWFGWGSWGRNRIYDETGKDISVTDGRWIISIGSSGWVGFLSIYLFLFIPIWMVFRKNKSMVFVTPQEKILLSAHSLIVALIMIDQLPNSSFNPLYFFLAGSLLGRAQVLLSKKRFSDETEVLSQKN